MLQLSWIDELSQLTTAAAAAAAAIDDAAAHKTEWRRLSTTHVLSLLHSTKTSHQSVPRSSPYLARHGDGPVTSFVGDIIDRNTNVQTSKSECYTG